MRNNLRNARKLWYATYKGQDYVRDENGDITGDIAVTWNAPVMFKASLSATRGTQGFTGTGERVDYFGADIDYSLIISTCNMQLPIDEYSLIWKHEPDTDSKGNVDFSRADYRVTAVARGQRHMKYAIKELAKTTLPDPFELLTNSNQGNQGAQDSQGTQDNQGSQDNQSSQGEQGGQDSQGDQVNQDNQGDSTPNDDIIIIP